MRLYPTVMAHTWDGVPDAIKRAHLSTGTLRGRFDVRRGSRRLARAIAGLMRFPAEGSGVPVTLRVEPDGAEERWHRTFAGRPLITRQRCRDAGILDEQVSILELRFRLEAGGGRLRYDQIGARLRLGRLAVPWPRWCRPRVEAVEIAEPGGVLVHVDVSLPRVGLLIGYRGRLDVPAGTS